MFTGIIEDIGKVIDIKNEGSNKRFFVSSQLRPELRPEQSVAHNGVCLTVEKVNPENYEIVAVQTTLEVSNIGQLQIGSLVNLERAMAANGRFEGHIVQGHVDTTATCKNIEKREGSLLLTFTLDDSKDQDLMVNKGSITINGVSLTLVQKVDHGFQVTIIPFTVENTIFYSLKTGNQVNIEFDILGKYIKAFNTKA